MHGLSAVTLALLVGGVQVLMTPDLLPSALGETPSSVAAVVARSDDRLVECMRRLGDDTSEYMKYLRANQIDLNGDDSPDYFVRPSLECNEEFMGAHAISFWLIAGRRGGGFDIVLSDAEDSLELLDTKTNGFRDIEVTYSVTVMPLRFNGKRYVGHKL